MTLGERKGLKFGILCDTLHLQQWQTLVIEQLILEGNALALIILNKEDSPQSQKEFEGFCAIP